jgi:hypothetical protein
MCAIQREIGVAIFDRKGLLSRGEALMFRLATPVEPPEIRRFAQVPEGEKIV